MNGGVAPAVARLRGKLKFVRTWVVVGEEYRLIRPKIADGAIAEP